MNFQDLSDYEKKIVFLENSDEKVPEICNDSLSLTSLTLLPETKFSLPQAR